MTVRHWPVVVLCLIPVGPLASQGLHYEGAVSVATGDYFFTQRTTSWTLATGLAFALGPVTLRGSVPVLMQNTTLLSGSISGGLPTGGGGDATRAVRDSSASRRGRGPGTGSGSLRMGPGLMTSVMGDPVEVPASAVTGFQTYVGDPTAQIAFSPPLAGRTAVGVAVTAKMPATDTSAFGTGEWDVGGSVFLSRQLSGVTLLGIDLGYWHLGDLPELELTDPWLASVMLSVIRPGGWGLSVSASGTKAVIEGFDDAYTVSAGVTRLGQRVIGSLMVTIGLTETTPDVSVGLSWRVPLVGR